MYAKLGESMPFSQTEKQGHQSFVMWLGEKSIEDWNCTLLHVVSEYNHHKLLYYLPEGGLHSFVLPAFSFLMHSY